MEEYKLSDVKKFAAHLKTLGAYVQQPTPAIVGLRSDQVIGSQDAKSLYPTIVVLLNIGYDTFRGRIFDWSIIGKLFEYMCKMKDMKKDDPDIIETSISNFKTTIFDVATRYANRTKMKDSKEKFKQFSRDFYGSLFAQILRADETMQQIMHPRTEEEYYLLKSCLFPLFEGFTWIHEANKGYNNTCVDYVFTNENFEKKYSGQKFMFLHDINSTKTQMFVLDLEQFKETVLDQYLITPYGTYFDKHDNKESFECPLILNGMSDRADVKNKMLIIEAIVENWDKLSDHLKESFFQDGKEIPKEDAIEVIKLVGDTDEGTRKWQLSVLNEIKFTTLREALDLKQIQDDLELDATQKNSESNGIKVTLNSGYGLNGLLTWSYGNNLIANSITTGGKIYGIKLFQQIAKNRLQKENIKIQSGFYKDTYKEPIEWSTDQKD